MAKKKEYTDVDYEMFVMPFGKYAQTEIEQLPAGYVLWIMDEDFCPQILKAWAEENEAELREHAIVESWDGITDF